MSLDSFSCSSVIFIFYLFFRTDSELHALGPFPAIVEESKDGADEKRLKDSAGDSDFVIEHPTFATMANMFKTEIPDYYNDCFFPYVIVQFCWSLIFRERHINWIACSSQSVFSIFSVLKHPLLLDNGTRRFEGLINSATGIRFSISMSF
jgi:hypothetical protein